MSTEQLAMLGGPPAVSSPAPAWPVFDDADRERLMSVLHSRVWGGYHPSVNEVEARMAESHGAEFGIATANGTVSLEIALAAAGIGPGDEVIVPPISFVASATAIARVGAIPVFADVDRATLNLSVSEAARAVTPRTRAVVLVHFAGCPADLDAVSALCAERRLTLIEDCAHAPGASWRGRPVGGFGAFGSFSFQASKNLTAGEGGMLITSDPELAERARSLTNQGRRSGGAWYEHVRLGTNARLTGFQAALLLSQLDKLPEQHRRRTESAAILRRGLHEIDGLVPAPENIDARVDGHAYHIFAMRYDPGAFHGLPRDRLVEALVAEGVPASSGYPHPLYMNPLFDDHPHRVQPCPETEAYCRASIWLPHNALLAEPGWLADVIRAIEKIQTYAPALR